MVSSNGRRLLVVLGSGRSENVRCFREVPLELFEDVTEAEAARICSEIRERLDDKNFDHAKYDGLYVKVLVLFNDTTAIDVLTKWKRHFQERQRYRIPPGSNWTWEIRELKGAIRHLKRVGRPDVWQWLKGAFKHAKRVE